MRMEAIGENESSANQTGTPEQFVTWEEIRALVMEKGEQTGYNSDGEEKEIRGKEGRKIRTQW